jgi:5'-nucleotidase
MPLPDRARRGRGFLPLMLLVAAAILIPAGVLAARPVEPRATTIQILNVSDWHGQIDPTGQTVGGVANTPVGGAWSIASRWAEDRLAYPSLTLTAGDDFGATPPLSGFFNEEPAVYTERMMGIQGNGLGNHNWDRGNAHLQQMIDIAGADTDAAHPGIPFTYLASNLSNLEGNLDGVEPYRTYVVGGVKVAVIGITNEEAPGLVTPGNFGSIDVTNGAAAANATAEFARAHGANVVLVITHKGVRGFDVNGNPFGELIDLANEVDSSVVDVILGDHTDVQYSGTINGILVHENRSKGVTYAKTLITAQRGVGGHVLSKSVEFVTPVAPALTTDQLKAGTCPDPASSAVAKYCDPAIMQWLIPYRIRLAELLDVKVGSLTATFVRGGNIERRQEVAQGDLIAEGMRWYQGTDFALMNGGSIRAPLPSSYAPLATSFRRPPAVEAPWDLLLGDIYTTLPFANTVLRRTVTGAQLWQALENGVSRIDSSGNGADGRFAQVAGLRYEFDYLLPTGCTGVTAATYVCTAGYDSGKQIGRVYRVTWPDGTPIAPDDQVYTLAVSSFVNQGGDFYRMLLDGQTGQNEILDAELFRLYLVHLGPLPTLSPTTDGRIFKCGGCFVPPA